MHYWQQFKLRDNNLEKLRRALLSRDQDQAARTDAFHTLLRSEDADAVCVAINYYASGASARFGGENRFAADTAEVLERARQVLRGEPVDEERAATCLLAVANLVEPQDADLVLKMLAVLREEEAVQASCYAAAHLLETLPPGDKRCEEMIALLARTAFDEAAPVHQRRPALDAIGASSSDTATDLLVRALGFDVIELQAVAGMALARHDLERFRPRLERMVAVWPEVSDFPAYQLVELLREG